MVVTMGTGPLVESTVPESMTSAGAPHSVSGHAIKLSIELLT